MPEYKRRFALYPSCFGRLRLGGLCKVARRHGMQVIAASKPGLHVYNEVGLYGTTTQKNAVVAEWEKYNNELKPRSFRAVFDVPLGAPKEHWVDAPTNHRAYCKRLLGPQWNCQCDYDDGSPLVAETGAESIHA